MENKVWSTLSPEVLEKIARLIKPTPTLTNVDLENGEVTFSDYKSQKDWLDVMADQVSYRDSVFKFLGDEFQADGVYFFNAVANFLKVNNFLPEITDELEEELSSTDLTLEDMDLNGLDMSEGREW